MRSRGSWPDAYPWACGGASTRDRAVDGQTHLTFPTDCPEALCFPSESLRPAGLVGNCYILQLLPKGGGKTVPQGMEVIRNKDPLRGHHASWFAALQMKGRLGYVPAWEGDGGWSGSETALGARANQAWPSPTTLSRAAGAESQAWGMGSQRHPLPPWPSGVRGGNRGPGLSLLRLLGVDAAFLIWCL